MTKIEGEKRLLRKLMLQVGLLRGMISDVYHRHTKKCDINGRIVKGIRVKKSDFSSQLVIQKSRILALIDEQQKEIGNLMDLIDDMNHLLRLLVHMEQANLAIQNRTRPDDLSSLIDPFDTPHEKFRRDMIEIENLKGSFEILHNELQKQREHISKFELQVGGLDEDYIYQSEEYMAGLTDTESLSFPQIQNFCRDLSASISKLINVSSYQSSSTHQAVGNVVEELKKIRLGPGIFAPSFYHYIRKLVFSYKDKASLERFLPYIILFLLSRVKKHMAKLYLQILRSTILLYNMPLAMKKKHKAFVVAGAIVAPLKSLKAIAGNTSDTELKIISQYYDEAKKSIERAFSPAKPLIDSYDEKVDNTGVEWIDRGAKLISLAHSFDCQMARCGYDPSCGPQIGEGLKADFEGFDDQVHFLVENWNVLIPKTILPAVQQYKIQK